MLGVTSFSDFRAFKVAKVLGVHFRSGQWGCLRCSSVITTIYRGTSRYCIVNAKQLKNLLGETEVSSSDFNTVKALVQGEVDTFLSFSFIRTQRIGVDSNNDHKVLFYAKPGICLAVGAEPTVRISERDDKNYAQQVFASMTIGATRMQEDLVGYIECDPS